MSESAYLTRAREWLRTSGWDHVDRFVDEPHVALASLLTQVRNETLEEAAKASESFCGLFDLPEPGDGPFTQQDKTIAQCQSGIANAVRALKATPAIQVGTPAAPLSPGDEVQQSEAGEQA